MTEEELLSRNNILEIINSNPYDRIEKECKATLNAKKLGIEDLFKKTLKRYEALIEKDKQNISSDKELPKSKYNIDSIEFAPYKCEIDGITDKNNIKFSYFPVIPVERYINEDTKTEKIKLIFYKEDRWNEIIVERCQLALNNRLILLSNYGLDINTENVRHYINYFSHIININDLKKYDSISHIGWKEDKFLPYDSRGIFDGEDDFKNIYQAISSKGNYDKWKTTIQELRKNKYVKLIMATVLASPLIEKLNIPTFIVNVWSSMSGSGKTLSCMAAMSIFGNPEVGGLTFSSNCTQNFYTTVASFMRNFTCYFDELQIVKNSKNIDFNSLIMDLCNGTEKGRLNKNSQAKSVKTWKNNFLFTNNDRMVFENAGEQIYNRVIDLEIRNKIVENGQDIAHIIKNNYGFAGKEYIKYIQSLGFEEVFNRFKRFYNEIIQTTKATDKQANSLACLLLANELANECIFHDDYVLGVEDIKEYINDKDEVRTCIKAKNYILDIIDVNVKKFNNTSFNENWGTLTNNECSINFVIIQRELKKGDFDFNTIKRDWAEMGFLKLNSQGKYKHSTTANGEKGTYVKLNI